MGATDTTVPMPQDPLDEGLPGAPLAWRWCRFESLSLDELYDALALRCRVFILEQGAYLDPDGLDRHAWHLLGHDAAGTLQAYLRVVDPGRRFAEPAPGRVLTAPEVRRHGAGRRLMGEALRRCALAWPGRDLRISAQTYLLRFYREFGFEPDGAEYLEDGIPHVEMLRKARP